MASSSRRTQHPKLPGKVQRVNVVPMTAEEFDRQRRAVVLKWVGLSALVIVVAGLAIWVFSRPSTSRTNWEDANRLLAEGKYDDALRAADVAVKNARHKYEALEVRSRIFRRMNDPARAAADLGAMIELRPDDIDLLVSRATLFAEMREPEKAIADLDKVIRQRPTAKAYLQRAVSNRDAGRAAKALEDFIKAAELDPSPNTLMQRGMAYAAMGKHDAAVADFNRAIEAAPDVPNTYRARAYSRDVIGDHAGADSDRKKAEELEVPTAHR